MYGKLNLDLHEHTRRDNQAIERVDRARGGFENIDDAFMRPHFELFARFLIDVRTPQHRIPFDPGRHGDGPAHPGVGPLGVIHDLFSRCVQRPVVVSFHPNSNSITSHKLSKTTSNYCADKNTASSAARIGTENSI